MTKFYQEFLKASNGAYPMLKFNSATYFKDKRELIVRFIISAFEVRNFDAEKENEVKALIEGIFPGVKVAVQYIRTYADKNVVKNKVLEYFNKYNQMIFRRLTDDNLLIFVGDDEIDVKLLLETPSYKMLVAGAMTEGLRNYLDIWFNQSVDVTAEERVIDPASATEEIIIDTVVERDPSIRLVEIRPGEKIYARGKINSITQLPNYISDVKTAADNVVLCGKVSNISSKLYRNKKYDPSDPKSGKEMLPLVRFMLDDTTAKIECVCFPSDEEAGILQSMGELSQIVCSGKVGISTYNNALSYTINAVFGCSIDFDSIKLKADKPTPARYTTVTPEPFEDIGQNSLFDDGRDVPQNMLGKAFVVFDLEATDKMPENAEIIEIAAIKLVDGKPTESFQTLVKPNIPIPKLITDITTITNEMVSGAPSIEDVIPDFFKFTRGAVLVGHNVAGYDYPLIAKYAGRLGYNFNNDMQDTLLLARTYLPELKSFALENISKSLGIMHVNAHRAMSDVLATVELLKIIYKRM